MIKMRLLQNSFFVLSGLLICTIVSSASAEVSTKDEFLKLTKKNLPAKICNEILHNQEVNKAILTAKINMNQKQCVAAMLDIFGKCKTQYDSQIPDEMNKDASQQWINKITECMGTEFIKNHLVKKK